MEADLKNKVAVVTGGSSGIGLAAVRMFLRQGARVAFCARGEERLREAEAALAKDFDPAHILARPLSVLDPDAVGQFAAEVEKQFGGACHALITNAGQGRVSTFADTTDADWREELELKFFSQIYPIRAFEAMLRRGAPSAIVGVNALLAYQPEPHMVATSAARSGVQNLLKSLATAFAPDNIRVNSILLGLVDSGQWQKRFDAREDKSVDRATWYRNLAADRGIPLGRVGAPEEAAAAIVFLASPAAGFITGARLEVSGGAARFA